MADPSRILPTGFLDWVDEHYEPDPTRDTSLWRCRRCGIVDYVTKHAAARHGDGVEVLPPAKPEQHHIW